MKKIINSLQLNNVGGMELLLALYPILSAYSYGRFYLSIFLLLALDVVVMTRKNWRLYHCRPLLLFTAYYIIHQVVLVLIGVNQSYFVNSTISSLIFLISLFFIIPAVDFKKLVGSINWISLICLIGMFYHVFLMMRGADISPIKIPFLPTPEADDTRLFEQGARPLSFFMEPQSYASYMLFALFFALLNGNYVWFGIIAFSLVLSTSTTGLAMLVVMVIIFVIMGNTKLSTKILIIFGALALGVFFFTSPLASMGLEKATNTDLETTSRVINGPVLASSLDLSSAIFGVPYANATDYYVQGHFDKSMIISDIEGRVFISAFWNVLVFYGVVGLSLFLWIYIYIYKKNKSILPLLACIIVALFTNPDLLGASWTMQLIYMMSYKPIISNNNESINVNYAIRK